MAISGSVLVITGVIGQVTRRRFVFEKEGGLAQFPRMRPLKKERVKIDFKTLEKTVSMPSNGHLTNANYVIFFNALCRVGV